MSGFVIIVDFRLKPGVRAASAVSSTTTPAPPAVTSPGCRRFDVLVPPGEPTASCSTRSMTTARPSSAHMKTPHFASFNRDSAAWWWTRMSTELDLACEGSAA